MSKLGSKHKCAECSARFYDLNKPKPECPKCGFVVGARKRRRKPVAAETATMTVDQEAEDYEDGIQELNLDADVIPTAIGGNDGDDNDNDPGLGGLSVDNDDDLEESDLPAGGTLLE